MPSIIWLFTQRESFIKKQDLRLTTEAYYSPIKNIHLCIFKQDSWLEFPLSSSNSPGHMVKSRI